MQCSTRILSNLSMSWTCSYWYNHVGVLRLRVLVIWSSRGSDFNSLFLFLTVLFLFVLCSHFKWNITLLQTFFFIYVRLKELVLWILVRQGENLDSETKKYIFVRNSLTFSLLSPSFFPSFPFLAAPFFCFEQHFLHTQKRMRRTMIPPRTAKATTAAMGTEEEKVAFFGQFRFR